MKIDEVMLGDLVSVSGRPIHVTLAVLNNWSDSIEPILLTPEILEKNGFERDKNISLYNAYTGINSRVTLHDDFMSMNSRNMWDVHVDSEDFCTIANCELTYVHQLQQLLRLCKIDKKIVI
jgi:hypothetical protein